jgi:hypothetical protein
MVVIPQNRCVRIKAHYTVIVGNGRPICRLRNLFYERPPCVLPYQPKYPPDSSINVNWLYPDSELHSDVLCYFVRFVVQSLSPIAILMGRLLISRADSSAASARRRTTAHPTVVSRVLCTGYVVNKKLSCVLISKIWTQLQ